MDSPYKPTRALIPQTSPEALYGPTVPSNASIIVAVDEVTSLKPDDIPGLQPPLPLSEEDRKAFSRSKRGIETSIDELATEFWGEDFCKQGDLWQMEFREVLARLEATLEVTLRVQMPHHAVHHRLARYIEYRAAYYKHTDDHPRPWSDVEYKSFDDWWARTVTWVLEGLVTTYHAHLDRFQPDSIDAYPSVNQHEARATDFEAALAALERRASEAETAQGELEHEHRELKREMRKLRRKIKARTMRLADNSRTRTLEQLRNTNRFGQP